MVVKGGFSGEMALKLTLKECTEIRWRNEIRANGAPGRENCAKATVELISMC